MEYPFDSDAELVAKTLEDACTRLLKGKKVAIAFSGGLDSSLIAHIAKRHCDATLYVAGVPGSHDRKAAKVATKALEMPLIELDLSLNSMRPLIAAIETSIPNPLPIEVAVIVPLARVCSSARENVVVTGTGADELFGGYARYARMAEGEREASMAQDYEALKHRGAASESSLASSFGKTVVQPYMDPALEEVVRGIQSEAHFYDGSRKALLRAAALKAGLPAELAKAPKKAAQYGSGATRLLSKLAKAKTAAETAR